MLGDRWDIPGKRNGHRAVFGHHDITTEHSATSLIAFEIVGWADGIERVPVTVEGIVKHRGRGSSIVKTIGAEQLVVWINAFVRAGSEATTAERDAGIEAGAPEEFRRWRDIDANIVAVGIQAIDRADLSIVEAHLQRMGGTALSIQINSIVHVGMDVLRGFAGADIGLNDI